MKLISRLLVVSSMVCAQAAFAQDAGVTGGGVGGAGGSASPPSGAGGAPSVNAPKTAPAAPAPAATPAPAPAPAPAAPINLTPTPTMAPAAEKPSGGGPASSGVGLSPTTPAIGGGTNITAKEAETLAPTTSGAADEWKMDFHGYMRAPLRVSFGPPTPVVLSSGAFTGTMGDPRPPGPQGSLPIDGTCPRPQFSCYPFGASGPPGTQWHSPTRVPGALYTTWEYTNTVTGPWAQLNFSYGNSKAMMTVIVDSYAQTDGGYRHLQAQQGIDQAFLTLHFPDALGDLGTLVWNIGSFQNRYGTAGKYDGGMYETYLFGRTHISGETLTATFSNLDAAGDWAVTVEHGFGAKIELVPFFNTQFYQVFANIPSGSNAGSPYLADRNPDYLPYAGPVPQGSTFVHHAHIGAKYQKLLTLGAHYLFTWTPDDNWHPINSRLENVSNLVPRFNGPIQGSMQITGVEGRLSGGAYGEAYLGYSYIDARNINALADSIEVLHSYGGYQFKQNFFGRTFNGHTGIYDGPQNETGTVHNISAQYSFSFGAYNRYPEDWWGDGPDLVLTAFGLLSIVNSKAPPIAGNRPDWDVSTKKLKWGLDLLYTPLYWIGFGGRFDMVQPDLDAAYARVPGNPGGSQLSFSTINARAVIRTQFVTHETVTLRYAHYFLGDAAFAPYPYEWLPRADADLVSLDAAMWW